MKPHTYIKNTVFHLVLGFLIYNIPLLANLYAFLILLFGIGYIIKNQNKNNEALYVAAYITGVEVFLRMTESSLMYEYGKYTIIITLFIGVLYSGIKKSSFIYFIF